MMDAAEADKRIDDLIAATASHETVQSTIDKLLEVAPIDRAITEKFFAEFVRVLPSLKGSLRTFFVNLGGDAAGRAYDLDGPEVEIDMSELQRTALRAARSAGFDPGGKLDKMPDVEITHSQHIAVMMTCIGLHLGRLSAVPDDAMRGMVASTLERAVILTEDDGAEHHNQVRTDEET